MTTNDDMPMALQTAMPIAMRKAMPIAMLSYTQTYGYLDGYP